MYPLKRNASRGGQIGCTLFITLLLGGIAVPVLRYPSIHPDEDGKVLMYIIGGGFGLFSLLLLYAAIHQLFALRSPVTEVHIAAQPLERGAHVRVLLRQRGPMDLESLRANLVGSKTTRRRKSTFTDDLGTFNFFDSGPVVVESGLPLQREAVLKVPKEVLPSGGGVAWQIEVWGKVRGRADFQHVFPVELT